MKALFVIAVIASTLCALHEAAHAAALGQNSRIILGRTLAERQPLVQVELAAHPGDMAGAVAQLRALGGKIRYLDTSVGYVRANVPAQALAGHLDFGSDVDAVAVFTSNQFDVELHSAHVNDTQDASPASDTSTPSPESFDSALAGAQYTGAPPMDADRFIAAHPTFDGRGVTIGFMESVDPQAPGLQTAYALDGKRIRKVADFGASGGPFELQNGGAPLGRDVGWVDMRSTVRSTNHRFTYSGKSYTAPYDGAFNIGTFYGGVSYVHFVNMHAGAPPDFPVLWDRQRHAVWFDTERSGRFDRGLRVGDYALTGQVFPLPLRIPSAHAGNLPSLDTHRAVRFVLKENLTPNFLKLFVLGVSLHPAMVGSSAAGNGMFGGRMNGIAPGARIIATEDQLPMTIETILYLVHHGADIITSQFDMHFADDSAQGVWDTMISRIAHRYATVFTWAAANDGPAMNSVESAASAPDVFGIGGFLSRQGERLNDGVNFEGEAVYSSRGPLLDGTLKPSVVAPTQWLADGSMDGEPTLLAGKFLLPRGYSVGGGTSQATPTAAGAIALLLSAAKQQGLHYNIASLERAIFSSTRTVEGTPVEQGYGLINVPAAWKSLQNTTPAANLTLSGRPTYDRNVPAGIPSTYDMTVTASAQIPVRVQWVGSPGGTIDSTSLTLETGVATPIRVHLGPMHTGEVRSGLIELRDASTGQILASRPITQISPYRFDASKRYAVSAQGQLAHPGGARFFFAVPPGVSVFALHLHEGVRGPGWHAKISRALAKFNPLAFIQPDGFTSPAVGFRVRYPASNDGNFTTAIAHPMPGTWQIVLDGGDALRNHDLAGAGQIPVSPVTIQASVYGLAQMGCTLRGNAKDCRFTNRFAPFRMSTASVPAPRRNIVAVVLRPEKLIQTIDIPVTSAHVEELRVAISGSDAANVGRDLYYCLPAPPTAPYPQGPWYRGSCFFRAHAEGNAVLRSSLPTGSDGIIDDTAEVKPGRWVVAVYPLRALAAPESVRAIIDSIESNAPRVTTTSLQTTIATNAAFSVTIRSRSMLIDPTIESPDVFAQYKPYITVAGGYSGKNGEQPIVRAPVPIWP